MRIFSKPEVRTAESVRVRWLANRTQNGWRAVGGELTLTAARLFFVPNIVDAALGGKGWEISLKDIGRVTIARARSFLREPFSGGVRRRLRIRSMEGGVDLFVVNDVERVKAAIQDALMPSGATVGADQ